jgi:hypothetical protein
MSEALRKRIQTESDRTERLALASTTACGVALPGGAIASLVYLLVALSSLVLARPSFAQPVAEAPGVRLEAGFEKEDAEGDLKSAMDIYQKIAADPSAPRDVRAKALLRLAGCDEKLGHQARQVYEQILHDYADQPAAAQARRRLAAIQQQEHPAESSSLAPTAARLSPWARVVGNTNSGCSVTLLLPRSSNLLFTHRSGYPDVLPARLSGNPDNTLIET